MDFQEQINNKSLEIRSVLASYRNYGLKDTGSVGNCSFIKTENQVSFKPRGDGKFRIGKITDELDKSYLQIRLDLPKNEFTDASIMKATGFKEIIPRNQRTNFTCLKVHRASWDESVFDTIDIKLYKEDIEVYDFHSTAFLKFIELLVFQATGDIIEIPNVW